MVSKAVDSDVAGARRSLGEARNEGEARQSTVGLRRMDSRSPLKGLAAQEIGQRELSRPSRSWLPSVRAGRRWILWSVSPVRRGSACVRQHRSEPHHPRRGNRINIEPRRGFRTADPLLRV